MKPVFDRCTDDTIDIFDRARDEARQFGHSYVGTEHVLLALAIHRDQLPSEAARLLPSEDQVRAALTRSIDDGPGAPNAELLGALGIDIEEVRTTVRQTFGDEAIQRMAERHVHQPWQPWRRPARACTSLLSGATSVAPRLKQALANAADRTPDDQSITPSTLLLGMLDVEDALSNRLLLNLGVAPDQLGAALEGAR